MMKPLLVLVALATVLVVALPPAVARAQFQVTEIDPADGAELDVPPEFVHLCFSQPANIEDIDSFQFEYQLPDGRHLGLRDVFQPDGSCVDVFPGLAGGYPAGEHRFSWRVTAAAGGEKTSGDIRLKILKGATPGLQESPQLTATPSAPDKTGGNAGNDDGGPGLLLISALAAAVIAAALGLGVLFYLVRRRAGFDPHRPPDEGGEDGH